MASSPEAAAVLAGRQGGQDLGVAQHRRRLPERADEVLALGQVHAGLAADGGVDLAEQRGGDVDDRDAAVVHRGGEPADVGDQPAADRDDGVGAGEAPLGEVAAQRLDGGQRLGRLALADGEDPVLATGIDVDADAVLGHDRHPAGAGGDHRRRARGGRRRRR